MKYYTALTDDEIRSICLCYPYKELITGFKKCPRDFSALFPGHRPQSVSEEVGRNLIANNPRSNLAAKMVEALLSSWVPKIAALVKEQVAEGKALDYAYIVAFCQQGGTSLARVYFRFCDENPSEDRICAICAGVEALSAERTQIKELRDSTTSSKEIEELKRQQAKEIKEHNQEEKKLATRIKSLENDLHKAQKEVASLLEDNKQIEYLQTLLSKARAEIAELKQKAQDDTICFQHVQCEFNEAQKREQQLLADNACVRAELAECQRLFAQIEREKQATLDRIYLDTPEQLRPVDMDEFSEYLSYNLVNIGLDRSKPYFSLLLGFLEKTIFLNKPIFCNQALGRILARCISNALCGSQNPTIVPYTKGITSGDIRAVLETDERILIFDSFIGNYSEMEMLPIIRSAKRKIIIVTAEYDKTITFLLPEEVLLNCTYINASRIPELFSMNGLDEDSSTLKEELILPLYRIPDKRANRLCKEIMIELGYPLAVANTFAEQMITEETLDEFLAFSIIPYAIEAYGISPYNSSSRLNNYAGFSGKSIHRDLLMEWFGDV